MSLERTFVSESIKKGDSVTEILSAVENINSNPRMGLQLDTKKIREVITKYELLKVYNPKKSNLRSRINRIFTEQINKIKEKPEVLSVRRRIIRTAMEEGGVYLQYVNCSRDYDHHLSAVEARIVYLKRLENGDVIKQRSKEILFYFCKPCNLIFDRTKRNII